MHVLKEYFHRLQLAIQALHISDETIRYYAIIATKAQIPQIARRGNDKYIYLLAFIVHQYYSIQDALVDMLLRAVQTATNKAEEAQKVMLREQHTSRSVAVERLLTNYLTKSELIAKIEQIVKSPELTDSEKVEAVQKLILAQQDKKQEAQEDEFVTLLKHAYGKKHRNADYYNSLQAQSLKLQKRVTEIIKHLVFDEASSRESTLTAISYFRQKDKTIGNDAPLDFLNDEEQNVIYDEKGNVRKSLYKVLLFNHIALFIKSGGLNLKHSYRYRSLDDYLIPKERWKKEKATLLQQLDLTQFADFATAIKKLEIELDERYRKTNEHILDGTNNYISLHKDGGFSLTTPKKEDEETGAAVDLFPRTNFIPLYEVLTTVQKTTNFLSAYEHLQLTHVGEKPDSKTFFAAIIGLGCNIGIKKIGKISRNINQSSLDRAVNWYLSEQSLSVANDAILSFTKTLYLPTLFQRDPAIIHTTSDGQQYPIGVESLTANYSYKYKRPGRKAINAYIFKDSRNLIYYSTVFSPSDREAIYVMDGMVHNTVVDPDMHSTDTGGVTEPVFAGMYLLNMFFAPRIKDIDTKQRYAFVKPKVYAAKGYQILPHGTTDTKLIEPQWDDMLRFMATIKLKHTTASQLFHRLNSY
ncbi:MAG TPA: Tn3 family transposase, partial [Methylomirabilota bacterium]|nr:Tn3 family transposase [Methylomirabilota bacterium]